jgi:hypothetical protein
VPGFLGWWQDSGPQLYKKNVGLKFIAKTFEDLLTVLDTLEIFGEHVLCETCQSFSFGISGGRILRSVWK